MSGLQVVGLYAGLLAVLFFLLAVRTIRLRRRFRVAVGDGGRPALLRAIRAHANFAEYVPLALLLQAILALQGLQPGLLHALGAALLAGRLAHAVGVSRVAEDLRWRVTGMALTFTTLLAAAVLLVYRAL